MTLTSQAIDQGVQVGLGVSMPGGSNKSSLWRGGDVLEVVIVMGIAPPAGLPQGKCRPSLKKPYSGIEDHKIITKYLHIISH